MRQQQQQQRCHCAQPHSFATASFSCVDVCSQLFTCCPVRTLLAAFPVPQQPRRFPSYIVIDKLFPRFEVCQQPTSVMPDRSMSSACATPSVAARRLIPTTNVLLAFGNALVFLFSRVGIPCQGPNRRAPSPRFETIRRGCASNAASDPASLLGRD